MPFDDYKESVAIYLRKSRMDPDSEDIDETLARHEDTLLKLAKQMDLNIVEIYKEVVSGDGLFTRPEMCRLLQNVEQGNYSAVLCMEIDRLGRSSQKDGGIILETFKDNDVRIITTSKTYDLNDDVDEQVVEMHSFIARQELKAIRRRLNRGIEKTVEMGYHICEPPYGYRRTYIDKRPTLEICEEEANVIRMVFDMYVNQHMGTQTIADNLNKMGYTPRKNDHFSRNTIQFYLQNETYIGQIIWNKRKHIKKKFPTDKHRTVLNPEEKWIVSEGKLPAIISKELFEQAREIHQFRTHPPTAHGIIRNPFAGLIYCKNCGELMQRQYSKISGNRLLCLHSGCIRSIRTMFVEKVILDAVKNILKNSSSAVQNSIQKTNNLQIEMLDRTIKDINTKIKQLNSQKSKLHDLLEQGVYDVDTFLDRSNAIAEKIQNSKLALAQHEKKLNSIQSVPTVQEVLPTLRYLIDEYDNLSAGEKNVIFKKLIKRMVYNRTKDHRGNDFDLDIEWRFTM